MPTPATDGFTPDYAVTPGEILEETLESRGIKKSEFAERCGLSAKTVSQIIHGKAPVTPETAIQFERVLGVSAAVWNNLEAFSRLHEAHFKVREKLEKQKAWARRFPVRELIKRGLIPSGKGPVNQIEGLLAFFGVGSIQAWEKRFQKMSVAYRRSPSFQAAPESVAAWLRIGERIAQGIDTSPFDRDAFGSALTEIRNMTTTLPRAFVPRMKERCRRAGVALVMVPELPRTHLSGATRWLSKDKALIMLSLRHKRDDHFWFTFFHEAGHIQLHGKKTVFIEEQGLEHNREEIEADRFAAHLLIPEGDYKRFTQDRGRPTRKAVQNFAAELGIAPGIVVGRLQHDRIIDFSWYNELVRRFHFSE